MLETKVVVRKSERGKGYGRVLMNMTEQHAVMLNFTSCYLTTHDKQNFYQHLGYEFCQPVVSLGNSSHLIADKKFANLFVSQKNTTSSTHESSVSSHTSRSSTAAPPPPPPPPPPVPSTTTMLNSHLIAWMRKILK
ncbi:uncharacterized protein LOC141901590 [Tubulanus polymorphus]|uniref:uncharacterized protein LOC141901590 n=1 Tax=Tubulanus polymorphus TaxID=672921 RepID=UPI003DA3DEB3